MNSKYIARKRTSVLVYFTIFIYLLMQMRCWIGFSGRTIIMQFALVVLLTVYGLLGAVKYQFKTKYIVFSLLYLLFLLYSAKVWEQGINIGGVISKIVPAVNILFILAIPDEDKNVFLGHIIKWFGWIFIPSLVLFIITQFVSLPNLGILLADYGSKIIDKRVYYNYVFYILPSDFNAYNFPRFNGPFLEPGDVGCVTAFLLVATQFEFKKIKLLWAICVALVASFSLAGWVLASLGYVFILFSKRRIKNGTLVLLVLFFLVVYLFGTYYNGGDNVLNNLILSRLQSDEERIISGNNRASLLLIDYFLYMFNDIHTVLFGYDSITVSYLFEESSGVGLIPIAIKLGILGVLLILLPYFVMTQNSKDCRFGWAFFVLILLYFFQRTEMYWIVITISYVYGIVINDRKNKIAL